MSAENDLYQNLLDQLQACATQEERDWIALRFSISQLPEPLRAAVQAAAVPRFFDRAFLNALLEQPLDEAQFAELTGLSYIEPYPGEGRFNVHERSRKLLQEKLWQENEELYREISRRAFAYCAKQDTIWRVEMVYNHLIVEPEAGAIALHATWADWASDDKAERLLRAAREHVELKRLPEQAGHCQFVSKIAKIRHALTKLWQRLEKDSILYYIPHGASHATSVENILYRLIPGELYKRLSKLERYYLTVAAWTHDIGMISGIDIDNEENLQPTQIREDHHRRSEQYIINNYSILEIDEKDGQVLGILAFFHSIREELETCPEYITINNQTVRLRLLAAYLRLADALAVDQSHASCSEYATCLTCDIPSIYKLGWIKSKFVSGISVIPLGAANIGAF